MSRLQEEVIASIPSYLRQFVVHQHYDEYTPQDHAVWRYVMRRNLDYLKNVAHPAYLVGLEKTGISLDYIPDIDDMNRRLEKIGWKAVVVDGFVPPAAFMEFQAHKILVISAEIRNIKNVLYTPAPDIIHEAAGHAPIIADDTYAEYLQRIGEYGARSVFSKLDYEIYEAIRHLSIIKEYPDATEEEIKQAEQDLEQKVAANTIPSESAYLARLHWWTVEYGLIGKVDDFKIYGAGILSSVGESKACMSAEVKKIPLSVETSKVDYDITRMQPQLFVAESFQHLLQVLEEFADTMCFRVGGYSSVKKVMASENVGTVVLDSGLQISGVITEAIPDSNGQIEFIRTEGVTSLAVDDKELDGHGIDYHADGFSSPLGRIQGVDAPFSELDDAALSDLGIESGNYTEIRYVSGYRVAGKIRNVLRHKGKLILVSFTDCTVRNPDGSTIFKPEWGVFDMAVGETVVSAFSGSADKERFNVYPPKSEKKAIKVVYTDREKELFNYYSEVDAMRAGTKPVDVQRLKEISRVLTDSFPKVWLLRLEILEQARKAGAEAEFTDQLEAELQSLRKLDETHDDLISSGLKLIG